MADTHWKLEAPPPVVDRVLGLDRRLLWPTAGVLLAVLLWSSIMPAIDRAIDGPETVPGAVYDMGVASFTPVPGWVLAKPPSPVGQQREAALVKGGITLTVQGSGWNGTSAELLDQVTRAQREFIVEGQTYQVRTGHGVPGVAKRISGPNYVGLIASFVDARAGIAITVKGPADAADELGRPVAEMIRSIVFKPTEARP